MSHVDNKLSLWLNEEIKRRHWSLRYVGRLGGISHATVARIANGELQGTERTCLALARVFGVPYDDLLRMAGILPSSVPTAPSAVRERRIVYEVNVEELVLELWRALSAADQGLVRELLERLAQATPRIME